MLEPVLQPGCGAAQMGTSRCIWTGLCEFLHLQKCLGLEPSNQGQLQPQLHPCEGRDIPLQSQWDKYIQP